MLNASIPHLCNNMAYIWLHCTAVADVKTTTVLQPFVWEYQGELVSEETFTTHSYPDHQPSFTCFIHLSANSRFALTPISTLVHPVPVTGFTQPLQINVFITLYMLPFIPLHFLCTHFWQLVHSIELLPTPLPQTLHGHLTAFCVTFCRSPLIITLGLLILFADVK